MILQKRSVLLLALMALVSVGPAAAGLMTGGPAGAAPAPIRIMPLGDSITRGEGDGNPLSSPGGYRPFLEDKLAASGYSFDFVGSLVEGPASLSDKDHEGHGGYRIDQLDAQVQAWLGAFQPDVVLLMIGTNDINQNYDIVNAPTRLGALIDKITAARPGAQVVVASIPPRSGPADSWTRQYNAAIPNLVESRSAQGKSVSYVDMYGALTVADLADSLHPNATGYSKLAAAWYGALSSLLPSPPPPPPTTSTTTTTTAPGGAASTFVGDLPPLSASNGYGPVERDLSNGGRAARDGGTITLNGVTYAKGLGVHAASTVVYALGGAYQGFATDVGVDDACGSSGSVVFRVFVDGVKVFDSAKMAGASATKSVLVSTAGKNELRLVVTNAGDGAACDHADWAGARLMTTTVGT